MDGDVKTHCPVCGLIYDSNGKQFIPLKREGERIVIISISLNEIDQLMWRVFLRNAHANGWLGTYVCSHGMEMRIRGTLKDLEKILSRIDELQMESAWVSGYRRVVAEVRLKGVGS